MREQNTVALVIPAHTLKGEARQFGAEPLADCAELIENSARICIETHSFPDELIADVVELRKLWNQTIELFDKATNPLADRAPRRRAGSAARSPTRVSAGSRAGRAAAAPTALPHRLQLASRARLRHSHSSGP